MADSMPHGETADLGGPGLKFREDEELEFFTELALHETERWMTAVTKKPFSYPDDTRKSLENGILLCELLNNIKPGSVKRINRLPTPIAGLDNIHVFLRACREHFGLNDNHLFDPSDLEDLSQRAIAESEHHLKEEIDRRLRNVAVTVYWIGRVAQHIYEGPKIDQTAFAALVHNQHRHRDHIVSDSQLRKESSSSWGLTFSSPTGLHPHGGINFASHGHSHNDHVGSRHMRNESYDSYTSCGKGSEDSLEDSFPVNELGMPIPRYNSTSGGLNHSQDSDADRGRMYSPADKGGGMYRSSPDLSSRSSTRNRRSSSTDSADGSFGHGGGHSRQSSDSAEVDYPTRRHSTQFHMRKSSASADPLQFVKSKGAVELAITAEEQIRLAAETKKLKIADTRSEDDSTDWQSNLSSWKNRRKSQSERTYHLKEELEQMEKEKEEPQMTSTLSTKTFSQMQQERERRKSAGNKFYPIEDEDDDIFTSTNVSQQKSFSTSKANEVNAKSLSKEVAPWAQDSDEEKQKKEDKTKQSPTTTEYHNSKGSNETAPETAERRPFVSSRSVDNKSFTASTEQKRASTTRESWIKANSDAKENSPSNSGSSSSASKPAGKISNILKSFEQKEEEVRSQKTVNVKADVSDRRKSFEKFGAHSVDSRSQSQRPMGSGAKRVEEQPSRISSRLDAATTNIVSPVSSTPTSAIYASNKNTGKDYIEKTIKISQKANNNKGFGFTLSGGSDRKLPVIVEKVALGTAADLCEVRKKDEVVAINSVSTTGMTSLEVNQKVEDAVRNGQIELRVKRYLGSGDDFGESEDFLSTDEEIDMPDRSASKSSSVRAENSFDSLDSREEQKIEENSNRWTEERTISATVTPQSARRGDPTSTSSDSGYDAQTFSPYYKGDNYSNYEEAGHTQTQVEPPEPLSLVETRHSYSRSEEEDDEADYVNMRNRQDLKLHDEPMAVLKKDTKGTNHENQYEMYIKSEANGSSNQTKVVEDSGDSGPPAVLRKWQRQRPRSDYTFESDEPSSGSFYSQIRMSSSLSRSHDESDDFTNANHTSLAASQPQHAFTREERKRLEEWNQQQEAERQTADLAPSGHTDSAPQLELTFPSHQRRFTAAREQMQQQYQAELQQAADAERLKQEEERKLLEPELEKQRLLEERRAQRQARLQQTAMQATPPPEPAPQQQQDQQLQQSQQQHTSTFSTQIQGSRGRQTEILVIDPRNRGIAQQPIDVGPTGHPYQFQFKINEIDREAVLEDERRRIREEEMQKIEAERRRLEEVGKRQLLEKEEQLRQKEAQLAQEREQLRREQERLEQEAQRLAQQQQQQRLTSSPQLYSYASAMQHHDDAADGYQFEMVTSKVREVSPAQTSSVSTGPRRSEAHSSGNTFRFDSAPNQDTVHYPRDGYGGRSAVGSDAQYYSNRSGESLTNSQAPSIRHEEGAPSGQASQSRWTPGREDSSRSGGTVAGPSRQYSREDMLVMNRRPTPLQSTPLPAQAGQEPSEQPPSGPITRQPPSKDQIRSLNSVPKARLKDPREWKMNEEAATHVPAHKVEKRIEVNHPRRDTPRENYNPQSHWLVQEAERRRQITAGQFSGPIKPAGDDFGNRWRVDQGENHMPAQIRQTLLQKTAGVRGSNSSQDLHPHSAPQQSFSQTLPRNFSYGDQERYNSRQPHQRRTPSPEQHRHENGMSVSGKQHCSHCGHEIGFGAAMVIESLGLYYHTQCFKCCVCRRPLGTGAEGADVRVKVNKLHCPDCYSSDEAGLKFSKV